jgi:hypothetical protein
VKLFESFERCSCRSILPKFEKTDLETFWPSGQLFRIGHHFRGAPSPVAPIPWWHIYGELSSNHTEQTKPESSNRSLPTSKPHRCHLEPWLKFGSKLGSQRAHSGSGYVAAWAQWTNHGYPGKTVAQTDESCVRLLNAQLLSEETLPTKRCGWFRKDKQLSRYHQIEITAELRRTFHDFDLSSSTIKSWIRKFKNGDLFCDDDSRPGWPTSILGPVLQKFLDRDPFSSTIVISRHFLTSPLTVKKILRRKLGLKKFNRRWVLHLLSDDRAKLRVVSSRKLLSLLGTYAERNFKRIATGDESWFRYSSYSDSRFPGSRESVVPRIRRDISDKKLCLSFSLH